MRSREEIKKVLARGEVVMTHTGHVIKTEADIPPSSELLGEDASAEDREAAIREAMRRRDEAERDLADLDPQARTTAGAQTRVMGTTEEAHLRRSVLTDSETPNDALDNVGEEGEQFTTRPVAGASRASGTRTARRVGEATRIADKDRTRQEDEARRQAEEAERLRVEEQRRKAAAGEAGTAGAPASAGQTPATGTGAGGGVDSLGKQPETTTEQK